MGNIVSPEINGERLAGESLKGHIALELYLNFMPRDSLLGKRSSDIRTHLITV